MGPPEATKLMKDSLLPPGLAPRGNTALPTSCVQISGLYNSERITLWGLKPTGFGNLCMYRLAVNSVTERSQVLFGNTSPQMV